jgi:hypothetical protein
MQTPHYTYIISAWPSTYMDELKIFLANAAGGHLENFLEDKFCVFDRGRNNTPNFNNSRRTRSERNTNETMALRYLDQYHEEVLGGMYHPMDPTNQQAGVWTEQLLREWAGGMLQLKACTGI